MRMQPDPEVFDPTSALASVGGDREFLSEVAGLFQAAWPTLCNDIRAGLAAGDFGAMERSARLVEAAARNLSARIVCESAHRLALLARQGALEDCEAACANLEHQVARLTPHLAPLRHP